MRQPIEYGILSTLMQRHYIADKELDDFLAFILSEDDINLFKSSRTTQVIAKAIYNHIKEDLPFDEVLIEQYILKRTHMDFAEWLEILKRLPMSYDSMLHYIKILKEMNAEEEIAKKMQEIG